MFYAHTEGRRLGVLRAITHGLRGATFNIMYPPSLDEVDATRGADELAITVNPQSFRLPYDEATWSPRGAEFLRGFGPLTAHDIADFDDYDTPRELNARGIDLCERLYRLQIDFGATEIIAPYFLSTGPDDPYFELSILCADYLEGAYPDQVTFTGVMMNWSALENAVNFDLFTNRITAPGSPDYYYFDFDFGNGKGRPLRNKQTLIMLKRLFDATDDAQKYSLLARCNLEGLLMRAASGLDAFSTSYYQSERAALHKALGTDYQNPSGRRAPTPYLFSRTLLTDIPRDVAQAIVVARHPRWLTCACGECTSVVTSNFGPGAWGRCPAHFYSCINALDMELDEMEDRDERIALMLDWVATAEHRSKSVIAKSGTFTHLHNWRIWLEGLAR